MEKQKREIQEISTTTFIKFDLWDSLKILVGRAVKIKIRMDIPQQNEISSFNAYETISIVKTSSHFIKKDKPDFGYMALGPKNNIHEPKANNN